MVDRNILVDKLLLEPSIESSISSPKLFSDFSSFGPSLASSLVGSPAQGSDKENTEVYEPPEQQHHKLRVTSSTNNSMRKISIHLVNQIMRMEKLQESSMKDTAANSKEDNSSRVSLSSNQGSTIKVYCRFKPGSNSGIRYDDTMVDDGNNHYSFDAICNEYATQQQVYNKIAKAHIDDFLGGSNTTIFAYGQTSSGKTHTMFGDLKNKADYGIIPRALEEVFGTLQTRNQKYQITCSMLEIYKEKLGDLFTSAVGKSQELKIKEGPRETYVEGLTEIAVENEEQMISLINMGHAVRKVGHTYHNDYSSRSHTLLIITYRDMDNSKKSKLYLIDLAGSEKVSKTGATGQTLQEAKKINLSLSCLGNVIYSLTSNSDHIPYRDSKLTRILKDSLCGNFKTSIITTCSLSKEDRAETISTMKFAARAKKIKNKQKLDNSELSMQEVIKNLRKQLEATRLELMKYKAKYSEISESIACSSEASEEVEDIAEESGMTQPLKSIPCNFNRLLLRSQASNHSAS